MAAKKLNSFNYYSKGEGSHFYFFAGFAAYILGLGVTMGILTIFNAAQPALLYLVPSCVGIPLLLSLVKGKIRDLICTSVICPFVHFPLKFFQNGHGHYICGSQKF